MAMAPPRPWLLTDPWFEAHFYSDVGVTVDALETSRLRHAKGSPITFEEAQGLFLWCPCGYGAIDKDGKERYPLDLRLNRGRPHGVIVPFADRGLPPTHGPVNDRGVHCRWQVSGASLADLTLTPSVLVGSPANNTVCWHGFITHGAIT